MIRTLGLGLFLGAAHAASAETAMIEMTTDGVSGTSLTQIFADGTILQDQTLPGKSPTHLVRHAPPAVFSAAAALLAAEGLPTKAALPDARTECLVAFAESLRALPPIAGFDQASASCPNPVLDRLMLKITHSLATP